MNVIQFPINGKFNQETFDSLLKDLEQEYRFGEGIIDQIRERAFQILKQKRNPTKDTIKSIIGASMSIVRCDNLPFFAQNLLFGRQSLISGLKEGGEELSIYYLQLVNKYHISYDEFVHNQQILKEEEISEIEAIIRKNIAENFDFNTDV